MLYGKLRTSVARAMDRNDPELHIVNLMRGMARALPPEQCEARGPAFKLIMACPDLLGQS